MPFDWFMGLVFLLRWIEYEASLNSVPKNFEPKPDEIFCAQFGHCRMTK
jgi:hypothetical protein